MNEIKTAVVGKSISFSVSCELTGRLVPADDDITPEELLDYLQNGQAEITSLFNQGGLAVRDRVSQAILGRVLQVSGGVKCDEFAEA
jgi:hypothetical protein